MADLNSPLFDIDKRGLEIEVNSYELGAGRIWPTLFPLRYTPTLDVKALSGDEKIPVNADLIAFNAKSPQKKRITTGGWSGTLGKISIARSKNEEDYKKYMSLSILSRYGGSPDLAQQLLDMIYDDIRFVEAGIDSKTEQLACIAGSNAMVILTEKNNNGIILQEGVNYNVSHKTGVTNKWSNRATATPLQDVIDQQNIIIKEGRLAPRYAFVEQATAENILRSDSTFKLVAPTLLIAAGFTDTRIMSIEMVNQYMRSKGYPEFVVINTRTMTELNSGEQIVEKPWRENVVVLSPSIQLGWMYWSDVPAVLNTASLQVYRGHMKVNRYSTLDPMLETSMAESYLFPALINRNSLVYINTENSSWAGGEVATTNSRGK